MSAISASDGPGQCRLRRRIEDVGYRRDFAGAALTELRRVDFAGLRPGALNLKEFARADDPDEDTVTEWLGKLNLSDLAT